MPLRLEGVQQAGAERFGAILQEEGAAEQCLVTHPKVFSTPPLLPEELSGLQVARTAVAYNLKASTLVHCQYGCLQSLF